MIAQEQEIANPYMLTSEKERERESERHTYMTIYTNLERKALLLSLFRKKVMGNKLRKLTLQGIKNGTNPTRLWE